MPPTNSAKKNFKNLKAKVVKLEEELAAVKGMVVQLTELAVQIAPAAVNRVDAGKCQPSTAENPSAPSKAKEVGVAVPDPAKATSYHKNRYTELTDDAFGSLIPDLSVH